MYAVYIYSIYVYTVYILFWSFELALIGKELFVYRLRVLTWLDVNSQPSTWEASAPVDSASGPGIFF